MHWNVTRAPGTWLSSASRTSRKCSPVAGRTQSGLAGGESRVLPPSALVRVDQEFLAGGALVVDRDVGELQRLLQRHHLRVVAGKGGLEFGGDTLAQAADFGGADLLQERRQQPAADAPGQAKCPAQFGRTVIEAAVNIDLLVHVGAVVAVFLVRFVCRNL